MNVKRIRTTIRIIMATFGLSLTAWLFISMQARNVDEALFESAQGIVVEESEAYLSFTPEADTSGVGILFYPGALVDPDAYVPIVYALAQAGYKGVIVKVPYRIDMQEWQKEAVFSNTLSLIDKGDKAWVLAGHSRGARRALEFVSRHERKTAGLILIGSSHPREVDHSGMQIPVMKVYATNDGLASPEEVALYRPNLPAHTEMIRIEGGNHAQFGWYGRQFGDEKAAISRENQQKQLIEAMLRFLRG